jgi:hypothetical protein
MSSGRGERIKPLVGEVADARREAEAENGADREDMVGKAFMFICFSSPIAARSGFAAGEA